MTRPEDHLNRTIREKRDATWWTPITREQVARQPPYPDPRQPPYPDPHRPYPDPRQPDPDPRQPDPHRPDADPRQPDPRQI